MLRIGTGAGFSSDRLDPARELAERGALDVLVFECIGERTMAFGRRDRRADPAAGYSQYLERRLRAVLPACVEHGTRIVTNMGVANPRAATEKAAEVARDLGLRGLKIACIEGDDVSERIDPGSEIPELGCTVGEVGRTLVGANAYVGVDALLPALASGAEVLISGRVADPSLFLAPMMAQYGWREDDWEALGAGTLAGHLLECAGQVTGGYFADPATKPVAGLARLGFPIAEIDADGAAVITKLDETGGVVDARTVKEQLLYEIHDPVAYLTPDVTADFSGATVEQVGPDRVRVTGASGRERPERLKVTLGFDGGFLAEGEIGYAGVGAHARARLAAEVLRERITGLHGVNEPLRIDLIGVASLHASAGAAAAHAEVADVRVRAALRTRSEETAELLLWEVESLLCNGPAGGGGFRGRATPSIVTYSCFIARDLVRPQLHVIEA